MGHTTEGAVPTRIEWPLGPEGTGAQPEGSLDMARSKSKTAKDATANLGFEAKLWLTADKLRNNMDAAEYKPVVLGLVFLKYISDTFEEQQHAKLVAGQGTSPAPILRTRTSTLPPTSSGSRRRRAGRISSLAPSCPASARTWTMRWLPASATTRA